MSASRIILLTGASRGLGRAMTHELVERGHTVFGCSRSQQAIAQLSKRYPAPHVFSRVDVSIDTDVVQWADQLLAQNPAPNLLLNNAALMNTPAPLWNVEPDAFSQLIDVNVKGVFHVLHRFLPAMIRQGHGIIVNFSSGWGRSTSADVAPYCCSKWAVEGLTRALADELPEGLAAVPVNPGVIATDMLHLCFGASAFGYPAPEAWAARAVPFLLNLTTDNNGQPLTVPS